MQQHSTRLLYQYWNEIRGARSAPDRRDVDPTRIREALASTFILESDDGLDFSFRLAGSHVCSSYCRELKTRSFAALWTPRDQDALDTLLRAVTEDHAAALIAFEGMTEQDEKLSFEMILLPLRHNGVTNARVLGAMTATDSPFWLGVRPIVSQRITGLRLIWPDDHREAARREFTASVAPEATATGMGGMSYVPMTAKVAGVSARKYAHLAVIDGGKS